MSKRTGGITLIEATVSVITLCVVVGAIVGAFVISKYSLTRVKHRAAAMNFVAARIEEAIDNPFGSFPVDTVTIDNCGSVDPSDDITGQRHTTVAVQDQAYEDSAPGAYYYRSVLVAVTWNERGWGGASTLTENAITYITQD